MSFSLAINVPTKWRKHCQNFTRFLPELKPQELRQMGIDFALFVISGDSPNRRLDSPSNAIGYCRTTKQSAGSPDKTMLFSTWVCRRESSPRHQPTHRRVLMYAEPFKVKDNPDLEDWRDRLIKVPAGTLPILRAAARVGCENPITWPMSNVGGFVGAETKRPRFRAVYRRPNFPSVGELTNKRHRSILESRKPDTQLETQSCFSRPVFFRKVSR